MWRGIEEMIVGIAIVAPALDFPQRLQAQQEAAEDANKTEFDVININLMPNP